MKVFAALAGMLLWPAAFGADSPVRQEKPLELEPMRIHEKPFISFTVDVAIYTPPGKSEVNRIFITRVIPGGDAEEAGLQEGDEIVALDGTPVRGLDPTVAAGTPLGRLLLARPPGERRDFGIRATRTRNLTLTATGRPPDTHFGVDVRLYVDPADQAVARMSISRVRPGTEAERSGLQPGDEITKLDGRDLKGMSSSLAEDSWLGQRLLRRPPGDKLELEVRTVRMMTVSLHAQLGIRDRY